MVEEVKEEAVEEVKEEKKEDPNWREVRQTLKSFKYENQELKKKIEDLSKPPPIPEKDEFEGLDEEDAATIGLLKQPVKKVKDLEKKLESLQQSLQVKEAQLAETQMRDKHQDYDYVIDNFAIPLIKENPQLAYALKSMPNWAEMAYNMAKSSPDYQQSMQEEQKPSKEAERTAKNIERPTSANGAGSLESQAEVFASMPKSEIWKRSQEFARRA